MNPSVVHRTLYQLRENLSATLSNTLNGSTSTNHFVVMNKGGGVLNAKTGTWSTCLENALEVEQTFDPVLFGGVAVVSVGIAREVILRRLKGELEVLEGNLRVT